MRAQNGTLEGVIRADELYTLRTFQSRLGLKDVAMRTLRRAGLKVIRFGNRAVVSGRQAIEFLESFAGDPAVGETKEPAVPGDA